MTSTALRYAQYCEEIGKHPVVNVCGNAMETPEYLAWLKTADAEYIAVEGYQVVYVLGPRSRKVDGALPTVCQCSGDCAATNAAYIAGLLNADAPASVRVEVVGTLDETTDKIQKELPEYLR